MAINSHRPKGIISRVCRRQMRMDSAPETDHYRALLIYLDGHRDVVFVLGKFYRLLRVRLVDSWWMSIRCEGVNFSEKKCKFYIENVLNQNR